LQDRLQLVADCWNLLDGSGGHLRRALCLPQGSKEPEPAYRQRLDHARPSGFRRGATGPMPICMPRCIGGSIPGG